MRAAVLGSPIAHSLSPVLHRAAYAELGLDWTYEAIEVPEGGLAGFLADLDDSWAGFSVTMPLKPEAAALARLRSETVVATKAANTLVPLGAGWSAENTDVPGLVDALREAGVAAMRTATVLGAGATAGSAVVALAALGADDVVVVARDAAAGERLIRLGAACGIQVAHRTFEAVAESLERELVVSTVPSGLYAQAEWALPAAPGVLFDVVYDPWPTPLAAGWAERHGTVIGGLELLVHQAVLQVELMTGRRPTAALLRRAGLAALRER